MAAPRLVLVGFDVRACVGRERAVADELVARMRVVGPGPTPTVGFVRGASDRLANELRKCKRCRVHGEGAHLTVVCGGDVRVDEPSARVHLVHAAGVGVASVAADVVPHDREWADAVKQLPPARAVVSGDDVRAYGVTVRSLRPRKSGRFEERVHECV
jgi:hypothetical protein